MRPRLAAFHRRVGQGSELASGCWAHFYPPGTMDRPPVSRAPRRGSKICRTNFRRVNKLLRVPRPPQVALSSPTTTADAVSDAARKLDIIQALQIDAFNPKPTFLILEISDTLGQFCSAFAFSKTYSLGTRDDRDFASAAPSRRQA